MISETQTAQPLPSTPAAAHRVAAPAPSAPRAGVRARLAIFVLLTANFTLAVDFSILNVALPRIGTDVGFSLADLQWISTAFAVCAAGFTLLFGRAADLFGRRRQFLAGIAVLGLASVVGGTADTPWVLLVARVAQGLATAAVTPAALALLTTSLPEGPLRDRALGLNGAVMAAGFTAGAVLGGLLTDLISWRWAFFVNVIVAAVVLPVGRVVLRENRSTDRPRMDGLGALTVTAALVTGVYGLTQAGQSSWVDPSCWGFLLGSAGLLIAFLAVERRVAQPLVPMGILTRGSVGWGNVAGMLAFATETSVVFLLTLYLQKVLGYSPLEAGLTFAVLGVGTVLGGMLAPRVIAHVGARNALAAGFAVQAASTVTLVFLGTESEWIVLLLAATFVGGVANLVAIVGFMVTATTDVPGEDHGLATGLATMSQQVGIALGTPIMSAIATSAAASSTVLHGVVLALGVNAAIALVACGVVLLALPASGRAVRA